jgi:thioredoxin 1
MSEVTPADQAALDAAAVAGSTLIVDFWAPWCSQCKAMAGTIERLAPEVEGRASVVTVNTEAHPGIADRYDVQSLPTILVLRAGEVQRRIHGFKRLPAILEELRGAL